MYCTVSVCVCVFFLHSSVYIYIASLKAVLVTSFSQGPEFVKNIGLRCILFGDSFFCNKCNYVQDKSEIEHHFNLYILHI